MAPDGGFFVTGQSLDLPMIARFDSNGNVLWGKIYEEDMPLIYRSLALNHTQDRLYLLYNGFGFVDGTISIAEFDFAGNLLRAKEFLQGTNGAVPGHLTVLGNGEIIINGHITTGLNASSIPYLLKINANWEILEARQYDVYADEEVSENLGKTHAFYNDEILAIHALSDNGFEITALKVPLDLQGSCSNAAISFSSQDIIFNSNDLTLTVTNNQTVTTSLTPVVSDDLFSQSFNCNEQGSVNFTDLSVSIIETECENGVQILSYEICNIGTENIAADMPIAFYAADPTLTNAPFIFQRTIPTLLAPDSCFVESINVAGSQIFLLGNEDGSRVTPFDLENDFFGIANQECNYTNNFAAVDLNNTISATLDLGPDLLFCEIEDTILDAGAGFESYVWNTGETSSQITVNAKDIYWVEVTDDCGLIQRDSIEVSLRDIEPLDLGEDFSVCAGESVFFNIEGYDTYEWSSNPDGTCETCPIFVFLAVLDIEVSLTVTKDGCEFSDTIFIEALGATIGSEDISICEGDSIEIGGVVYTESTSFSQFLTSAAGCDSIAFTSISVDSGIFTEENQFYCEGDVATVFGIDYTQNDVASATFIGQNGCDSTHQITLVFDEITQSEINLTPCEGEVLEVLGNNITENDTLFQTLTNSVGCDSIIQINIFYIENAITSEDQTACAGTIVNLFGNNYTQDTIVEAIFPAANGCDSIHQVNLSFTDLQNTSETISACEGDVLNIFGNDVTADSILTATFISQNGCDSIHQVFVTFEKIINTSELVQLCPDESITIFGITIVQDTTLQVVLTAASGCDSIHQITVSYLEDIFTEETQFFCEGQVVTIFGNNYSQNTFVSATFTGQNGCDSIHQITLIFNEDVQTSELIEACEGEVVIVLGSSITEAQTIFQTFSLPNGCDSTHQIEVVFLANSLAFETLEFCVGDTALISGNIFTNNGLVTEILSAQNGCDSIIETSILFNDILENTQNETICADDYFLFFGDTIRQAGIYETVFPANGQNCETIEILNLEVLPAIDFILPNDTLISKGQFFQIPLIVSDENYQFQWSPMEGLSCSDCQQPLVQVLGNQIYTVTILNENNCFEQGSIHLITQPETLVYFPNVFSPNNDGFNDFFTAFGNERLVNIKEMQIFNRWGSLIFAESDLTPNSPAVGWGGRYGESDAEIGVYIYQVLVEYDDGTIARFSGDVSLIR